MAVSRCIAHRRTDTLQAGDVTDDAVHRDSIHGADHNVRRAARVALFC